MAENEHCSNNALIKIMRDTLDFSIYIGNNCFPKEMKNNERTDLDYHKIVYSTPLVIRALHKAHAINTLVNEKLFDEAKIILRVLLELSFVMCAIVRDNDFIHRYINDSKLQELKRLKNIKKASEYEECCFSVDATFNSMLEELKKQLKDIKEIKIVEYAEKANMSALYYSSYSRLCSFIHSSSKEIEEYFIFDKDKKLTIKKPVDDNIEFLYFSAIESMTNIINAYAYLLNIKNEKINEFNTMYNELKEMVEVF